MTEKGIKIGNIGYFPIPKVACTSIKTALFIVEHDRPHDPVLDDGSNVHQFYKRKCREIDDCGFRFIVIRDPIRRFLSAYNNRVGHHKELTYESVREKSPDALKNIEVFQPNITQFIDDFETYYSVKSIRHHTRPISEMLSVGLSSFTHVYKIEELGKLKSELENRLGREIVIPRLQTGGTDVDLRDLSRKQIEFLMDFYQEDYRLLSGHYDVDSVWREWRGADIYEKESAPFIIWTFRRTGGTNLSDTLFAASNFDGCEHEPFNPNRGLHWIVDRWRKHKDKASLYRDLDKVLSKKILVKHCLEIMPAELNSAIATLSIKYGYRHLFLYREEAVGRLLSLNYSMKTDIWSKDQARESVVDDKVFKEKIPIKKLIRHEIDARREMQRVYELLLDSGNSPLSISFEQLYNSQFSEASDRVKHLFQELIGEESVCNHDFIDKLLNKGGQNTRSEYVRFSNSEAFIDEVKKLPRFLLTEESKPVGEKNLNPLVSVIIPVYNVSEYINRCLDSVINQTYTNIEILVVDDRGQDDSMAKVNDYDDSRIRVISHKKNRGLSAARNTGIDAANGEFLIFLDSDDYVDHDLIRKCILRQQKSDVDCVVFNTQFVDDAGHTWVNEWMEQFFGREIESKCIDDEGVYALVGWDVAAWSKLIRLEHLKRNKIYFLEEQRYFEDHYFSAKLFMSKARFSYINERLHYYFKRSSPNNKSITQTNTPAMGLHRSRVLRDVCLLIESVDYKYKNAFHPVYFHVYKEIISDAFGSKRYRKEVYDNLRRVFSGIAGLDILKEKDNICDLDLALLMSHYDYDEYMAKFGSVWNYSVLDVKEITPSVLHSRLQGWVPHRQSTEIRFGLGMGVSAVLFIMLSLYRFKVFRYRDFLLRLRDFYVIFRLGDVNYPERARGLKRCLRIFDYVVHGEKSGDKINSRFAGSKYLELNPNLGFMNMGLYAHFLFYAESQGRDITGLK
ncbi:MAG: glycosyltransferase [Candidatus Sedimenticola sp. 20ELBAFRAG]